MDGGSTFASVKAELEAADRASSYLGQAALALASRIDRSRSVVGFAALVRELRTTMDAVLADVPKPLDTVDEFRLRYLQRKQAQEAEWAAGAGDGDAIDVLSRAVTRPCHR